MAKCKDNGNNRSIGVPFLLSLMLTMVSTILLLMSGCTSSEPAARKCEGLKDYNLIFITIDSLRADHLGCYGYKRDTTPFIDSLAKEGVLFRRAMSNSSFTAESVSVLFTGRLPSSGGSLGWSAAPARKIKKFGDYYLEAGFETAFFSNSSVVRGEVFADGFKEKHHITKWGVSGQGPELSKRACEFMHKNKTRKFMMYLHYLDPHGPYNPPAEFYLKFAPQVFPQPLALYGAVRENCSQLIKNGFGPGNPRFDDLVLRYDAEIRHIDYSIKMVFEQLERLRLMDNTLVIITADHGEEFLEHGYVEHAWTLYNESLHVPLIIWAPRVFKNRSIPALVSIVDLLPTLLYLQDIPHRQEHFDGSYLFQGKNNMTRFVAPQKPYIAELFIQHRNLLRAVIKDEWKYIYAARWVPPDKRPEILKMNISQFEMDKKKHLGPWSLAVHEELYHLADDPAERNNISDEKKTREFRRILDIYKLYCQKKGIKKQGNRVERKLSKEDEKNLKSLGYL